MEILEIFKDLSFVMFATLVLLSFFGKIRDGYILGAIVTLAVNFWICAKLGEKPNVSLYIIVLLIYISAIVIVMWRATKKETKPVRHPGSSIDEGH